MDSLTPAVPPAPSFSLGFTLTEMAVVLVIVALLIGGLLLPLAAQQDLRNVAETRRLLGEASEALYGYAATHFANDGKPYLPCPDTNGDGRENRDGDTCAQQEGDLPWADLGVGRRDAWGNPLRYRVSAAFSDKAAGFSLTKEGDLRVCEERACTHVLADQVPAVIFSRGKNGNDNNTADADEQENMDDDNDFVQHPPLPNGFDDLLVWLPRSILVHRMIQAGRLP